MPYVLFLFIALPIIEIALLLRVGDAIGWLPTPGIVILTAIIGTAMLKQQGIATLSRARMRLENGQVPASEMLEGLLLAIGGALLLTPGFATDTFGFLCLLPPTRQWMAARIAARSELIVSASMSGSSTADGDDGRGGPRAARRHPDSGTVIDGEYREIDDR